MLEVYGFSRVNKFAHGNTRDLRVLWALEEMGLPYEIVGMDHPNHDLERDDFRAKNLFAQLPVIDDDGVVVTESGAILLYLARKSGKLIPHDPAGEAQVLRWSIAALSSIEVPVLSMWFVGINGGQGTKPHDALRRWSDMRLQQLDEWLTNRTFIATDDFTVADILMTHVLSAASTCQSPGSWGQRRAFSPASWDHLIARVMGPPARVGDRFSPGSWGQRIARLMGPPVLALG